MPEQKQLHGNIHPGTFRRRNAISVILLVILMGCDAFEFRSDLEVIRARGVLRVVTRNNGTCYYEGAQREEGFEHDLAAAYAKHLNVELQLRVLEHEAAMIESLQKGESDIVAAGFIVTDELRGRLNYGPVYHRIQHLVVGRRDGPSLKVPADLTGKSLWVPAGVVYEKPLQLLQRQHREISWLAVSGYESEEMLEMVSRGLIAFTVSDSDTVSINRRYYPELAVYFPVDEGYPLAWILPLRSPQLRDSLYRWFSLPSTQALLERLKEHYYGHLDRFDYVDITAFRKRIEERLPLFREHFRTAAAENRLDWKLVAAQAYQESHWNPRARSFTGVRGIMMLTRKTARDLGISDRIDPEQSIFGGAAYLARLHRRLGNAVREPDRTFMALAAYNVGWGHLQDARRLARSLEKDPNSWADLRSTLPLLRLKKHHRNLTHGYARGLEPVRYVDRIRTYYKVLSHWEQQPRRKDPAAAADR